MMRTSQMDALETEMSTLKRLIHSPQAPHPRTHSHSSPKSTSNSLHPPSQAHSPSHKHKRPSIKRAVHKIQKRTGLSLSRSPGSLKRTSAPALMLVEHRGGLKGETLSLGEVSETGFEEFLLFQSLSGLSLHPSLCLSLRSTKKSSLSSVNG